MTSFWFGMAILAILLLLCLFYPLLAARKTGFFFNRHRQSEMASNVELYQEALANLELQHQNAEIDEPVYQQIVLELQKQFLVDSGEAASADNGAAFTSRSDGASFFVMAGLALSVMLFSYLFYMKLGAYKAISLENDYNTYLLYHQQSLKKGEMPEPGHSEMLVKALSDKVAADETNAGYRYMLASLYVMRNQFDLAAENYKTLLMANPAQERLLTEYLQVLYLLAGRRVNERVKFVADRALDLNPHNLDVLGLLAMDAYENQAYQQAVDYWRKMLVVVDADSERARMIRFAISEAEAQFLNP
ncbi:MAG: c-type cytochrome biogenesis protein CcmI [Pseudomonadales bacterium]|nr:c-type cytochrome biogenesis protein CcmI [Pseudomonadales bacterium]